MLCNAAGMVAEPFLKPNGCNATGAMLHRAKSTALLHATLRCHVLLKHIKTDANGIWTVNEEKEYRERESTIAYRQKRRNTFYGDS